MLSGIRSPHDVNESMEDVKASGELGSGPKSNGGIDIFTKPNMMFKKPKDIKNVKPDKSKVAPMNRTAQRGSGLADIADL